MQSAAGKSDPITSGLPTIHSESGLAFLTKVSRRRYVLFADGILRKTGPEHWSFTLRLLFGGFILNDVPMLD